MIELDCCERLDAGFQEWAKNDGDSSTTITVMGSSEEQNC